MTLQATEEHSMPVPESSDGGLASIMAELTKRGSILCQDCGAVRKERVCLSMITIKEPAIFAVMEPVQNAQKAVSDDPIN